MPAFFIGLTDLIKLLPPLADLYGMRNEKISAAKRLINALESDLDFDLYLDAHPNTERALNRLMQDVSNQDEQKNKVFPHSPIGDDLEVKPKAA